MTCDMHYELDWSYRLRTNISCADAVEIDPCFATTACMCDTGYYRVAETMPKKRSGLIYNGFVEVFEEFERREVAKENGISIDEDDKILELMEDW